ncbi:hypothetical protein [Sinimarinibacterium thermocellulolyticum]|uniref:SGNH/GDSL hydrolase family protein n=1 Tax=Sinimarinibacterium thermocellulolyticum TaxID=3170016 RepID=A0ABV2A9K7_9GAMM
MLAAALTLLGLTAAAELWLRCAAVHRDAVVAAIVGAHEGRGSGVILGHSHTFALGARLKGYDNLSIPGANIPTMRALAAIRIRGAPLRHAIVAAGPELLSVASLARGDSGLGDILALGPLYLLQAPLARRLVPSLLRPTAGAEAEMRALGVGDRWNEVAPERRAIWTGARVDQQRPGTGAERDAHLQIYAAMLADLRAAGVQICLVRTPVTPAYLQAIATDPAFVAAEQALRGLAVQAGAHWIDFREMQPPLALSAFLNQDHVNAVGAARFAPWLRRRCEDSAR